MSNRSVIIIGSGFAGLSAASFMAKEGWSVTVLEKNKIPGGRAGILQEKGFTFDTGPSFYWMPDVFENYFGKFGKQACDYYQLDRLDPSYRIYWENDFTDVPADYQALEHLFESLEPGSARQLQKYLEGAAYKYRIGINKLVFKPGQSFTEFLNWDTIKGVFHLDVFTSIKKHIHKYFRHPKLRQMMEFPVLFLGALPEETPALYSLMNYADIHGGTWHPKGGMYSVVKGMHRLAQELGVQFHFSQNVNEIIIKNNRATGVVTDQATFTADVIISNADYHFTETSLLPVRSQTYSESYWSKRVMAPSCLLYYVGLNKRLKNIRHHSLFFDKPFEQHGNEIYKDPRWPTDPLFYVSAASVTDENAAPQGCESLVILIPVASGLEDDTPELRSGYFDRVIKRMEAHTGQDISDSIIFQKSYSVSDFVNDFNSFRGNAYGLANTLRQTAIFRPSCRSKRVRNLFYTGQLTVPGPGVPPSLISGEVVAREVNRSYS